MAVNDLDMEVVEGQIHGLIGPNGSGKTTVFNLVSGFLRPSRGKVIWQGRDITNMPTHRITKLGLARTFQLTALFKEITALTERDYELSPPYRRQSLAAILAG